LNHTTIRRSAIHPAGLVMKFAPWLAAKLIVKKTHSASTYTRTPIIQPGRLSLYRLNTYRSTSAVAMMIHVAVLTGSESGLKSLISVVFTAFVIESPIR
jgi:hypothetical protein